MDDNDAFPLPSNLPSSWTQALTRQLLQHVNLEDYAAAQRLPFVDNDVPVCYLIASGSVSVHRNADNLMIYRISAPLVLGLGMIRDVYIQTQEPCRLATLPLPQAHQLIQDNNLWELFARHMTMLSSKLYSHSKLLTAPTSYETTRTLLIALMREPEALRANTSAERYIRDRTLLSRSGVMKILSALKAGGYIVIEEGRLREIKKLPLKY